jgi:uncharacterized protein (TIGR01319 family)
VTTTALLIDFGSTFTKVTAVDLARGRLIGRAQAPSTVATDVCDGLLRALGQLDGLFKAPPRDLDVLDGYFVRACSSAAGGLRIVVVGLVPGLTVAAGNAAALGAGGKIVGAFGFKLGAADLDAIAKLHPDVILLTGGTDGGDTATILHNAAALAASSLSAQFVIAGNATAASAAHAALRSKEAVVAANVMPRANVLAPAAAQEEIRHVFMRHIVDGKGLERITGRVPVVLPTPMAVQQAAVLAARDCGNLVLVDVGGATTDVNSIGEGRAHGHDVIPQGLPEPAVKRTVEGDLGIRWNAHGIVERVGATYLMSEVHRAFPELAVGRDEFGAYVRQLHEHTDSLPAAPWQQAIDAVLARAAIDVAIERHAGRREPYYAAGGCVYLQSGKDLTEFQTMIATGGIFTRNPYVDRAMAGPVRQHDRVEVLRPAQPHLLYDRDYVLYAAGLLAESHPNIARDMIERHVLANRGAVAAVHTHVHDDSCCDGEHAPLHTAEEAR